MTNMSSDNHELTAFLDDLSKSDGHYMDNGILDTKLWFEQAIPEPTGEHKRIQMGCHFEEFAEMLVSIGYENTPELESVESESNWWKGKSTTFTDKQDDMITHCDKDALLDSLVDQIVTAVGVGHMMSMDVLGALNEVNRSNFSKFENGKAVFDGNGKIRKGEHYSPPDLKPFI